MGKGLLPAIATELQRIGAGPDQAGEVDAIGVNDEDDGWASLGASDTRRDLYWYWTAEEILERLARVPSGGGPEAVRAEFRVDLPDRLRGHHRGDGSR
jgi:hypothetical protein